MPEMDKGIPCLVVDLANEQVRDANDAAARLWNLSPSALTQKGLSELFDPMTIAAFRAWADRDSDQLLSYPVGLVGTNAQDDVNRLTRWEAEARFCGNGGLIEIRLASQAPGDMATEVRRLQWAVEAYARSAKALIRAKSTREMAERVCSAIVERADYALAVIAMAEPAPSRIMRTVGIAGDAQDYFIGITLSSDPSKLSGQGPTGLAMRTGTPYVMYDSHLDPVFAPWRERADSFGIRSSVTVPFKAGDTEMGAVIVYARTPHAFDHREVEIFQELGEEFAFAMSVIADQARLEAARRSQLEAEAAARAKQAELTRVSRVLMLGEFASSIAHELAQPVAAIITNSETALRWLSATPPNLEGAVQAVQRTIRDAGRAHDVIKRTRALIAREEPDLAACDINLLIEEVVFLLHEELIRAAIHVEIDLDPGRPMVLANAVQIQQVLINLIINARDAMRSMTTDRCLRLSSEQTSEGEVAVSVADNGQGLDPATLDQVFENFFSTKKNGVGLGLPLSRSIMEMHGGRISARQGEGGGAIFTFVLPLIAGAQL